MMAKKTLILTLVAAYSLLLSWSVTWAWQTNIKGAANSSNQANSVAVDTTGNVVAAGFTNAMCVDLDCQIYISTFTVVKFDGATGTDLWRKEINGTANGGWAHAVVVDAAGNVVAAGSIENIGTGADFTVIKFDGVSGQELWRQVINGFANSDDRASAVAVDVAGNVVAAGSTNGICTGYDCEFDYHPSDLTVIKFDGASGVELWRKEINGTANGHDWANAVAVDAVGSVLAAGTTSNSATFGDLRDFTVIKLDGANGQELWRSVISGTGISEDHAFAIAVDVGGNVVSAGYIYNAGNASDFIVVKFDGVSGQELWRRVIHGTAPDYEYAKAVGVDAAKNVVAAGYTNNSNTGNDFTVIKFDGANGQELWRQVIHGKGGENYFHESANAVAVDGAGNVVAAGTTVNLRAENDFTVVKFDGVSGQELWRQVFNGTASGYDTANAVAVDAAGNVVAVGSSTNNATGSDFTVVKFIGTPPPPPQPPPPPGPLVIGATTLVTGEVGVFFTSDLMISGGVAPYFVSTQGKLPAGLSLGNDGIISGTLSPTARSEKITVQIIDFVNESISKTFTVTVLKALRIVGKPKTGRVGNNYSDSLKTRGGLGPFNWNITSGAGPGLSFNTATGALTGIPTQAGEFPLTVQVTDALGGTAVENLTLKIR